MVIWLLAGLTWPIFATNCDLVEDDPEAAAVGDEISPAYYRLKGSRMPVIVLGEPIRVWGTEGEKDEDWPGYVLSPNFGDVEGDDQEYEEGDEEGGGELQPSLPTPPPNINMRQVGPNCFLDLPFKNH